MRRHRKVFIWWGKHWAVQAQFGWHLSFGIHIDMRYVDFHVLWLIISLGNNPVLTNERDRQRGSCRGFLFADDPVL